MDQTLGSVHSDDTYYMKHHLEPDIPCLLPHPCTGPSSLSPQKKIWKKKKKTKNREKGLKAKKQEQKI